MQSLMFGAVGIVTRLSRTRGEVMTQLIAVKDVLLRMALVCWCVDPGHGMTPSQHTWLTTRLHDHTLLIPKERERLRQPLLAWCQRCGGERLAAAVARQFEEAVLELREVRRECS